MQGNRAHHLLMLFPYHPQGAPRGYLLIFFKSWPFIRQLLFAEIHGTVANSVIEEPQLMLLQISLNGTKGHIVHNHY